MENNALFSYRRKPGMNTITVNKKGDRGGGRLTAAPIELPVSEKGSVLYIRCDEQGWPFLPLPYQKSTRHHVCRTWKGNCGILGI